MHLYTMHPPRVYKCITLVKYFFICIDAQEGVC